MIARWQFARWQWLVVVCLAVGLTFAQGEAQETKQEPETEPAPEAEAASSPRAVTVAVASFDNNSPLTSLDPFCIGGTPQTLAARLRRVYMLNVRDSVKTYEALTLQEIPFARIPVTDEPAMRKACDAADVQSLVVGNYKEVKGDGVKPETTLKISASVFRRETGKVEEAGTVEGALKDLPRLHADLTAKVLEKFRALGVPVRTVEWLEATREDAVPLDAYALYAEGNTLWFQKKADEAQPKFREAYEKSNGGFDAALTAFERLGRQRIESLEKMGGDVQAEIQKEDDNLKSLLTENSPNAELLLASHDAWKADLLRKKGAMEEAKKAHAAAVTHYQSFLAKGSAQSVKWKTKMRAPAQPFTSDVRPTIVNGLVYTGSLDGYVYAFDLQNGERGWRYRTGQPVLTTPHVANGIVYVGCDDNALYALDAASGQVKWKYETKAAVWSAPTVADNVVFFGSNDRHLYALDAASGQLQWKFETQGPVVGSPRVANGIVYVGSRDNRFYAVDASSGKEQWKIPMTGNIVTTAVVENGVVYFGANDGQAYAVDAATGSVKWRTRLDAFVQGSPALSDGTLYVGSTNSLYALEAATGSVKWKVPATGAPAPVVEGDALYVSLGDENVYILDAKTGQMRWRFPTTARVTSSPRPSGKSLLVASGQHLYALTPQESSANLLEDDALYQLGLAYYEVNDYAKTRDTLKQLLERRPLYNPDMYRVLADSYRHLNQAGEEVAARLTSFALQPTDPQNMGNVLNRLHEISGLQWMFRADGRVYWASNVDNNTIYVGSNDRNVYAIRTDTGQVKWKTSINAPAWFAPIIGGNVIYVTNAQGAVYALDKVNGAIRWRSPTTPGLPSGPPVLAGNQVIVSAAGGTLFSLNATTGQRNWTKTYGAVLSSPWAADNVLYFTARDGNLYACDQRTLDDKWKVEVGASNHTPIYDQGTLFVSSQKVRAVEAGTGRIKWEFNADAACSEPAVTADLVCFGSSNGYVYALNKTSGQEKWKFWTLAGGVAPQVTVADDTLYACTANGQIYALDLNSGALKWKFLTTGRLLSAPTIANGKLFAACEDRSIYAIDLAQATQLRAEGKTWWKELWSDEVAQAMIMTNADLRRRHLQRADELAEDNFGLHFEIGWRACDAKDYDAARQQADTLKKLDPEHPDAPWLLARIAKDQKRFADAEKHLREVARLSPRVIKVYVELDEVMEAQGKKFVPAEIMPPNAALAAALAETYNQKNQFEKAIAEYRRAIALDPQYSPPYNNLAWLYATCENKKLRNPKESLRLALKAIELSPRVAPILDTLAEAYYVNEQHDNAIDAISQAISLDRNNAHYRAQLAKFKKAKQAG